MHSYFLRRFAALFILYSVSNLVIIAEDEPTNIFQVNVQTGFDGNLMWVGVLAKDSVDQITEWSQSNSRDFAVEYSAPFGELIVVVLKRNAVPIVESLTPDLITVGISVEFSNGASAVGSVVSAKDGLSISEGLVSVQFDESLDIPIPQGEPVFTWELEEDGKFEIRGLPLGEHSVSVIAPGYMPVEQTLLVESPDQTHELHFQLSKAEYIHGRVVDFEYRSRVESSFDVSVYPPESQTAEVETEFDRELNFKLGPFAEGAVVELVAQTTNNLRSRPIEVSLPTDKLLIYVHRWIRVKGSVQARDSGERISKFTFITGIEYDEKTDVIDQNGQFSVEICDEFRIISILAPGYAFWASEEIDFGAIDEDELDLGIIELEPVYSVRGLVLDQASGKLIQEANVFRFDTRVQSRRTTYVAKWNVGEIRTTTDSDGEFHLAGFPQRGGGITVSAPGYLSQSRHIEDVNVPLEFQLVPSTSLRGQVVSLAGEPVSAWVSVLGYGGKRTDDGNFQFNVGSGTYRLVAFADLGESKVVDVTIESGQLAENVRMVIEIVGRIHGKITGLLKDETASVFVEGDTGSIEYNVSNGLFELTGVPSGSHVVKCETSLGRELNRTAFVDENLEGSVDLDFTGGSSLSGRVVAGADGLADYEIQALPENPELPVVRTRTLRDGSYRIEGLLDEYYRVEIPSRSFTQQIVVQGDTHADLHLSANRLFGKITSNDEIAGSEVLLKGGTEEQEISLWTKVNADGSYRFNNIPSGTYSIKITHSDYQSVSQLVDVEHGQVELDLQLVEKNQSVEH